MTDPEDIPLLLLTPKKLLPDERQALSLEEEQKKLHCAIWLQSCSRTHRLWCKCADWTSHISRRACGGGGGGVSGGAEAGTGDDIRVDEFGRLVDSRAEARSPCVTPQRSNEVSSLPGTQTDTEFSPKKPYSVSFDLVERWMRGDHSPSKKTLKMMNLTRAARKSPKLPRRMKRGRKTNKSLKALLDAVAHESSESSMSDTDSDASFVD
nr:MAG: ORF3 [Torque teno felis virus]